MLKRVAIVLAVAGGALAAAPVTGAPGASDDAPSSPVSAAAQLFTCCTPAPFQERLFSEADASGAEYMRVDVELHGIFGAAGDRPDWSHLDAMLAIARRHRVKLLGILRGTPPWLSTCPGRGAQTTICPPRDPAEWGRLAGAVAEHARGTIDHWEIVNEPDARWAFTGSAGDYARMLSAAYDAIKQRAPGAQVVFGGVERPDRHEWIERVLATRGADAAHKFDVANVHLRLRQGDVLPDLAGWLTGWRALLARHGFTGPVWVTEHGYPAEPAFQRDPSYQGGDPGQAAFLRASIPSLAEAGADQVFVTLRDGAYGEFLYEGIVHVDEAQPTYPATRRPAFATVRAIARNWPAIAVARADGRRHARTAQAYQRLAAASQAAGRPLAAALQQGAADGHAQLAVELAQAAPGVP
jgi:hypothetical protein